MSEIFSGAMYIFLFFAFYFEVFILLTFLERVEEKEESNSAPLLSRYPTVSIIVPAFNEEDAVAETIRSILSLSYPKDKLTIIAVDDGSTDTTWEKLQEFCSNPQVQLIHKENGGKHTALNTAIATCTSEIVGCLDSDSTVHPDALLHSVHEFLFDESLDAVTPGLRIRNPRTLLERIQSAEYTLGVFMRKAFSLMNAQMVTPGPFSLFKRSVFTRLGEYRKAHNTEDLEYALRIQEAQGRIGNAPRALVYTPGKRTLSSLLQQRVRWTYGFLKNSGDYKHMYFNKKYGDFSMFMLPNAFLTVFTAVVLAFFGVITIITTLAHKYTAYRYGGFDFSLSFNWFFLNTDALIFLTIGMLALTLTLMLVGISLVKDKINPFNIGTYFLLYGFMAPLWLFQAIVRALFGRETSWQTERTK